MSWRQFVVPPYQHDVLHAEDHVLHGTVGPGLHAFAERLTSAYAAIYVVSAGARMANFTLRSNPADDTDSSATASSP